MLTKDKINLAKAGDRSAVCEILNGLKPLLENQCHAVPQQLQKRIRESDLIQETMFNVHKGISSFQGEEPEQLLDWSKAIYKQHLQAACRHHLQVQKRGLNKEVYSQSELDSFIELAGPYSTQTPSKIMMKKEEFESAMKILEQLPDLQKNVVLMSYLQGLTHKQIAENLGKTEGAIAGLLARGLKKFKELSQSRDD